MRYLKGWETSVMSRKVYTKAQKNLMLLSKETKECLQITCMNVIIK